MDKAETLALYEQGKEAWNAWAEDILARRPELEKADEWDDKSRVYFQDHHFGDLVDFGEFVFPGYAGFGGATFSDDAGFDGAIFSGNVGFAGATFSGEATFSGVTFSGNAGFPATIFSGDAAFDETTFSGDARFDGVIFSGEAWFDRATFSGDTRFDWAIFSGDAGFGKTTFSGDARFEGATYSHYAGFGGATFSSYAAFRGATFWGEAGFRQSAFKGFTNFADCKFDGEADFSAIRGETAFSLHGVGFSEVPDFNQAHFEEAPRLDALRIAPRGLKSQISTILEKGFKTDRDLTTATRWSELKRLAVQRHDHQHELEFFRGELLERRGAADKIWHAAFWFGVLYQIFSGFGRSVLRPFFWWAVGVAGFSWAYLAEHVARAGYIAALGNSEGSWVFVLWRTIGAVTGSASSLSCIVGTSNPWSAALGLSLQKALFAGIGSIRKLDQIQACLFGIHGNQPAPGTPPTSFQPVIPDSMSILGVFQFFWSAAMIFLILLALRNHFRIK
jgi:uncharacterized protein YjbI with pentapeptide repeats